MNFGRVDKEPTSFELWIFKKIFLPIVVVLMALSLYTCEKQKYDCKNYCLDEEYLGYKFVYRKRMPNKCYCYPTEDTKSKEAYESRVKVNAFK